MPSARNLFLRENLSYVSNVKFKGESQGLCNFEDLQEGCGCVVANCDQTSCLVAKFVRSHHRAAASLFAKIAKSNFSPRIEAADDVGRNAWLAT